MTGRASPGAGGVSGVCGVCDLLSAVPHAALNRGAFALRENQPETATRYPTRNAFAEETAWLLWRLQRAGRYAPAADA